MKALLKKYIKHLKFSFIEGKEAAFAVWTAWRTLTWGNSLGFGHDLGGNSSLDMHSVV